MNEEDFITKFYSCDNEERFLKDICHNLNCLQKVQNNWNELKKWLEENESFDDYCNETTFTSILEKMQELQGDDKN